MATRKKKKAEEPLIDDNLMLHQDLFNSFVHWQDQYCLRYHRFRMSELRFIEMWIARLSIVEEPSEEAKAELAHLKEEYKTKWKPLRAKMEESRW